MVDTAGETKGVSKRPIRGRESTGRYLLATTDALEETSFPFAVVTGILLTSLVAIVDYCTARYAAFYVFYMIPVILLTAAVGRRAGILMSGVSALAIFVCDVFPGLSEGRDLVRHVLSGVFNLGGFLICSLLLSLLVDSLRREKDAARVDWLTGACTVREFYRAARSEVSRSCRYGHPLSLAYIDLNNFKHINDSYGHALGDTVLKTFAEHVGKGIRETDVVARLGGDEFAVLMPEADGEAAREAIERIQGSVAREFSKRKWPVSFSAGIVTFRRDPPESVDLMIRAADSLMYAAKRNGELVGVTFGSGEELREEDDFLPEGVWMDDGVPVEHMPSHSPDVRRRER
jgi:diguanylate cyclase (GGDEF)-like protein